MDPMSHKHLHTCISICILSLPYIMGVSSHLQVRRTAPNPSEPRHRSVFPYATHEARESHLVVLYKCMSTSTSSLS